MGAQRPHKRTLPLALRMLCKLLSTCQAIEQAFSPIGFRISFRISFRTVYGSNRVWPVTLANDVSFDFLIHLRLFSDFSRPKSVTWAYLIKLIIPHDQAQRE